MTDGRGNRGFKAHLSHRCGCADVNDTAKERSITERRPFALDVQTLDLGALAPQHRSEIATAPSSGNRAFDPHIFRRDFPILQQQVNGRPLIWLDNGATTQKPQGDRSPRPLL